MDVKIKDLVEYIKENFPEGCGHTGPCPVSCPLLNCEKASLENDICNMLADHEYRTNGSE